MIELVLALLLSATAVQAPPADAEVTEERAEAGETNGHGNPVEADRASEPADGEAAPQEEEEEERVCRRVTEYDDFGRRRSRRSCRPR